jgi:PAS domain S-box-containing protein
MRRTRSVLRYLFAVLTVAAALGVRMLLRPWTGVGAPFVFFFSTVLVSSVFWGAGPGLLAGFIAASISAFLFVSQAGYTTTQAISQTVLFLLETSIVCILADRFANAKRRSELYERAARQAQHLANLGSWTWDPESDRAEWSEEAYRIFGVDPKLPAPAFYDGHPVLFTPESSTRLRTAVDGALRYAASYEVELEFLHPDGSARSVTLRGEPIRDASGRTCGLHGTVQDITELKRLQRMREEWTSVIAHDLRQPIGTIMMCADLLTRAGEGIREEREKFTGKIRTSAFNLARMVDDLLDVSQMETQRLHLERKWIDPLRLVRETVDRLAYVMKDLHVDISGSSDLLPVFADPGRVEQILGNLLSNAVKYGREREEIRVRLKRHKDEVEISVMNHGKGIAEEEISRLFDRFSRAKSSRTLGVPGLGLGLYISKGLVDAHGGRIWVESVPNFTTTFYFTLPVRVVRTEEAA